MATNNAVSIDDFIYETKKVTTNDRKYEIHRFRYSI